MINKKQVQELLRAKIKEKGIQKQQLAAKIGVRRETISYYLNSTSHHFITAIKLLHELDIEVKEFYKEQQAFNWSKELQKSIIQLDKNVFVDVLYTVEIDGNVDYINFVNAKHYNKHIAFDIIEEVEEVIFIEREEPFIGRISKKIETFENDFINKVLNEVKKEIF